LVESNRKTLWDDLEKSESFIQPRLFENFACGGSFLDLGNYDEASEND